MKPNCKLGGSLSVLLKAADPRSKGNLCTGCCYTIDECPHSKTISAGYSTYTIIDLEKDEVLPKSRAWCKECKKEISVPIAKVRYNRQNAYILECKQCGSRYMMYQIDYKRKYVGFVNMKGDFVPASIDGKLPPHLQKKYEKESIEQRIKLWMDFGYTEEEAKVKIIEIDQKDKQNSIKFNREWENRINEINKEKRQKETERKSEERKRLIKEGVLIYNKHLKCLVNKNTGEVYKL